MHRLIVVAIIASALAPLLPAQQGTLDGTWQGIFHPGPQQFRVVLEIGHTPRGELTADIYSPDQGPEPLQVDSIQANGREVHFSVSEVGATWSGTLSEDGRVLRGTIVQGDSSALDLTRVTGAALWVDPHIHGKAESVIVQPGVTLQFIDWGGTGRPVLLLTGLGNTAHIYDRFAQKLVGNYHVYGITRRGFGKSSRPSPNDTANYTADRLGDDVVAVIHALGLHKPVLVGHSIAGEELSAVANHHPEAASALVYLDAGFPYALYDPTVGDYHLDLLTLQRQLTGLLPGAVPPQDASDLLKAVAGELPVFQRDLANETEMQAILPHPPKGPDHDGAPRPLTPSDAIIRGEEKFTSIPLPALAIFAVPHNVHGLVPDNDANKLKKAEALDLDSMTRVSNSFAKNVPGATVLRLAHAEHYVFLSNEAEVLKAIQSFLAAHN